MFQSNGPHLLLPQKCVYDIDKGGLYLDKI